MAVVAAIELGRVGPDTAYELARRADQPQADAIIMPGGNWSWMPVVERLEQELDKPVLVNNAVSLWAGLRLLKRNDSIGGYGARCCATIWLDGFGARDAHGGTRPSHPPPERGRRPAATLTQRRPSPGAGDRRATRICASDLRQQV